MDRQLVTEPVVTEPGSVPSADGGQDVAPEAFTPHDCLHLDPSTRADAALRLKSVRGHVEGVIRMLEDPGVYCVDVLKQVSAVQGAVRKVSEAVLRSHIRDHVVTAAQRGDADQIVDELMEALKYRV